MIELFKRKRVDKQYSDRPTNLEQLIEKYGLEQIWGYIEELVSNANEINDEKVFIGDPVGSVKMFAGANIPNTWLLCDGSAVSRIAYPELFEAIGTAYGEGDGSTTFNLPDMRGNVPVGLNENDTDFNTLGKTGGSKYLQAHTHSIYPYNDDFNNSSGGSPYGTTHDGSWNKITNSEFKTESSGTGNSGNLQPYNILNYIIKASSTYGVINKNSNIEVIDNLTSTSINNALSANQGRELNEKIEKTSKLIYSKTVTANEKNGWNITDIELKEGKFYKVYFDGALDESSASQTDILMLVFQYNNETNPDISRGMIFGSDFGNSINVYVNNKYTRIARAVKGYGCHSETSLCYRSGLVRATTISTCYTPEASTSILMNMSTMLGRYTGNITSIQVGFSRPNTTINEGSLLEIYELP